MSVVVVTGANGFIGRHVVEHCAFAGDDVIPIAHRWRDADALRDLLDRRQVDRCIHLGWYATPSDYLTNASENLRSLLSSVELHDVLIEHGCRYLVVAGSCAEYAGSSTPLTENAPIAPWSVYGAAKASLHVLLGSSLRAAQLKVAWARLFNITGPGEDPRRLLPTVKANLLAGRATALSPGDQVRDYLDVRDVASALAHLARTETAGVFNVCSGRAVLLRDLLVLLADACCAPRELLRFGERDYAPNDSMMTVGDCTRLLESGWAPRLTLEATICGLRQIPAAMSSFPR